MSEIYNRMFKSKASSSPLNQNDPNKPHRSDAYNRVNVQDLQDMGEIKSNKKGSYVVNEKLTNSPKDTLHLPKKFDKQVGNLINETAYEKQGDKNAWDTIKAEYNASHGGAKEWKKDKHEFYLNPAGKIGYVPTDDGENQITEGIPANRLGINNN